MASDVTIIIEDGGALGEGGGPVPPPISAPFGLYADLPSTFTLTGALVDQWGVTTQTGAARPSVITDTVTSLTAVRTDSATSLVAGSGDLDFASSEPASFVLVFRQRLYTSDTEKVLLDTTNGGTQAGVQLVLRNNVGVTNIRQLLARVYDGATWIVDYTPGGPVEAYQSLMWTVAVLEITATSLVITIDGYPWLNYTFAPITFPAAPAAPAVIGNSQVDLLAVEAWPGSIDAVAATVRLRARFGLPFRPVLLWDDPNLGESDPSGCTLSDNTFLALCTYNPGPGSNIGAIQARTSSDGLNWTPTPGNGTNPGLILPFTAPVGGGMFDPVCLSLSNGSVLAFANQTTLTSVRALTAANPAAVRANVWTNERVITQGSPILEIAAGQPCEDPANPGHVYLPVYRQMSGEAFWSGYVYKSTDNGATFPTLTKFADGVADSINYAEPGVTVVTAATAAKYSDLTAGEFVFLIRDDANDTMWEFTSSNGSAPFTRRATNLVAFSAARFVQLQDGTIVTLLRDVVYQYNTLYRRTGVVGGVAQYVAAPAAPAVMPTFLDLNTGQYGNICNEVTEGIPLVITATRLGLARCQVYARFWPEWQLYGQMPATIAPTSAALNTGQTQTFIANGAGNFTFTLPGDTTGSSVGSTSGVFTAGASSGSATVRATDLNGWHVDAVVTVTGSGVSLPDTANMVFNFPFNSDITGSGNSLSAANAHGGASAATPPTGLAPGYGSTTQNGLQTLDFSGGSGAIMRTTLPSNLSDITFLCTFKTGVITGLQSLGGNAAATSVFRIDNGVPKVVDYPNGTAVVTFSDLSVGASEAHTIVYRKTSGVWECWLDGTKSTVVSSNVGTNPWGTASPFTLGNDDATVLLEAYLGQECEAVLWSVSESTGNIAQAFSAMQGKWATP